MFLLLLQRHMDFVKLKLVFKTRDENVGSVGVTTGLCNLRKKIPGCVWPSRRWVEGAAASMHNGTHSWKPMMHWPHTGNWCPVAIVTPMVPSKLHVELPRLARSTRDVRPQSALRSPIQLIQRRKHLQPLVSLAPCKHFRDASITNSDDCMGDSSSALSSKRLSTEGLFAQHFKRGVTNKSRAYSNHFNQDGTNTNQAPRRADTIAIL